MKKGRIVRKDKKEGRKDGKEGRKNSKEERKRIVRKEE